MNFPDVGQISALILAAGALGTAAFGIVEALKWTPLGTAGFHWVGRLLGPLFAALERAYGAEFESVLRAAYQDGRGKGEVRSLLRQGTRIGLHPDEAEGMARFVGTVDATSLRGAAEKLQTGGEDMTEAQRAALGRFELAVDARIDAALARAETAYVGTMRVTAGLVALLIAIVTACAIAGSVAQADWSLALVVGITAVPLAPVANDVVGAIQAAAQALRRRP